MPLKFSSALFDKIKKEYWTKEHVKGLPFLIAIADFHDTMSMTWSFPALTDYLYGYKYLFDDEDFHMKSIKINSFTKKSGIEIPAGFFFQPNTENISAIIFSSTATIGKFNRMGRQAGLGESKSTIIRMGIKHDLREVLLIKPFINEINENCKELWSEGVYIFHNPNALLPLKEGVFPSCSHHYFNPKDKKIISTFPDFFPYCSVNLNIFK